MISAVAPNNLYNEVPLAEWERRKEFVNFTKEDVKILKSLHKINEKYADEILDELYARFLKFEETKAFFNNQDTLNRVKSLQKEYFLGLTRGEYSQEYLSNRLLIGRVHRHIGLEPRWYMGAYSIYMQLVFKLIAKEHQGQLEMVQKSYLALMKIFTLDKELAMTAYIAPVEQALIAQAQEILELSTPVVSLWKNVVFMPIIGVLDSRRSEMFMERLLTRIVETNSLIALLDITGVPTIDSQTARHLIETVTAVQLIGSKVILTGIRPPIAQTLVHLGISLGDIITRYTLSAGLQLAFDMLNIKIANPA